MGMFSVYEVISALPLHSYPSDLLQAEELSFPLHCLREGMTQDLSPIFTFEFGKERSAGHKYKRFWKNVVKFTFRVPGVYCWVRS